MQSNYPSFAHGDVKLPALPVKLTRSVGLLVLMVSALTGCSKKPEGTKAGEGPAVTTEPVSSASAPAPSVSAAPRPPREPLPQGASAPLFSATRSLTADDALKEKIRAAQTTAAGAEGAASEASKDASSKYSTELATQVRAGKVEPAKLAALLEAIEATTKDRLLAEAEGLNQLHAALNAEQRQGLVDELTKREKLREERLTRAVHARSGKDAGPPRPNRSDVHHIDRLTKDLSLDDAQKASVSAFAVKDEGEPPAIAKRKKLTETLHAAFVKDTFDAKTQPAFALRTLTEPLEEESKFIAKLTAVLKPEQREKLAGKVEKGWPLYDRANPYTRGRLMGFPGRLGPGSAHGPGGALPLFPGKPPTTQPPPADD